MTSVSDQTSVVTRPPGTTVQSSENVNAPVASNVTSVSSSGASFSDTIVSGIESTAAAVNSALKEAMSTAQVAARRLTAPGEFSKGSTNYQNRPTIAVVKNSTVNSQTTQQVIGTYSDWYCSSIQEQDMERTDVIETFGAPHVFTSGRFTRKIIFSGMVRTTAFNSASSQALNRVPQHELLRNFYESFLRSTAQAQTDTYTRITVDGDIYEGYITSLQLPRDASMEMVMQFALTMICVRRSSIYDADAATSLAKFVTPSNKQLAPAFASASMKDAVGDFSLKIGVGAGNPGSSAIYNTGKVNPDGSLVGAQQTIVLASSSGGQILSVSGDGDLWSLVYDDGTPVNGSACRGGSVTVKLVLNSYANLKDQAEGGVTNATLYISTSSDVTCQLDIVSVADQAATMILQSMQVVLSNGAIYSSTNASKTAATTVVAGSRAAATTPVTGTWQIAFDIIVSLATTDGVALPASAVPASPTPDVATLTSDSVLSALRLLRGGLSSNLPYDNGLLVSAVDMTSVVVSSPSAGNIKFAGLIVTFHSLIDVSQFNPFALADTIQSNLVLTLNIPTYATFNGTLRVELGMGTPNLINSLLTPSPAPAPTITPDGRDDSGNPQYRMYFYLSCTPAALAAGVPDAVYEQFLNVATMSIQYNQGALAFRLNQSGSGVLSIGKVSSNITITSQAFKGLPTQVTFAIDFAAPSGTSDADAITVFGSPLSGSISFPPAYNFATIPLTFTK